MNELLIQDRVWERCSEAMFDALTSGAGRATLTAYNNFELFRPGMFIDLKIEKLVKGLLYQRQVTWDHKHLAKMVDEMLYLETCGRIPEMMKSIEDAVPASVAEK